MDIKPAGDPGVYTIHGQVAATTLISTSIAYQALISISASHVVFVDDSRQETRGEKGAQSRADRQTIGRTRYHGINTACKPIRTRRAYRLGWKGSSSRSLHTAVKVVRAVTLRVSDAGVGREGLREA